jgi:glutathione synthase/RimK-type ligase-like ATP-grasp enzyme
LRSISSLCAIQEITKRLDLEFYGIDCSLDRDGKMLLFEANANMNILTNDHPQMNERMDMIKGKIHAMLARHSGEEVI